MPAKSQKQQQLFGMVRALQRGEVDPRDVTSQVRQIAKEMSPEEVEDLASTDHEKLPVYKKNKSKKKVQRESRLTELSEAKLYEEARLLESVMSKKFGARLDESIQKLTRILESGNLPPKLVRLVEDELSQKMKDRLARQQAMKVWNNKNASDESRSQARAILKGFAKKYGNRMSDANAQGVAALSKAAQNLGKARTLDTMGAKGWLPNPETALATKYRTSGVDTQKKIANKAARDLIRLKAMRDRVNVGSRSKPIDLGTEDDPGVFGPSMGLLNFATPTKGGGLDFDVLEPDSTEYDVSPRGARKQQGVAVVSPDDATSLSPEFTGKKRRNRNTASADADQKVTAPSPPDYMHGRHLYKPGVDSNKPQRWKFGEPEPADIRLSAARGGVERAPFSTIQRPASDIDSSAAKRQLAHDAATRDLEKRRAEYPKVRGALESRGNGMSENNNNISFNDVVENYRGLGDFISGQRRFAEIAEQLSGIAEMAEQTITNELAEDWFDGYTVKRNMGEMKKYVTEFAKLATEADQQNQRMGAYYEDMGRILERYLGVYSENVSDVNMDFTDPNAVINYTDPNQLGEAVINELDPNWYDAVKALNKVRQNKAVRDWDGGNASYEKQFGSYADAKNAEIRAKDLKKSQKRRIANTPNHPDQKKEYYRKGAWGGIQDSVNELSSEVNMEDHFKEKGKRQKRIAGKAKDKGSKPTGKFDYRKWSREREEKKNPAGRANRGSYSDQNESASNVKPDFTKPNEMVVMESEMDTKAVAEYRSLLSESRRAKFDKLPKVTQVELAWKLI